MTTEFKFECQTCGHVHEGIPSFGWDYPLPVLHVPPQERAERVNLGTDDCVIDGKEFYVRGCLEIPIIGRIEPFVWGAWVSLSQKSFERYVELYDAEGRATESAFFGWLCNMPPGYPDEEFVKTMVHLRPVPTRPYIALELTEHHLAVEQRNGITIERVKEITETVLHQKEQRT